MFTFKRGGVHPPENKLSAHQSIEEIPLPQKVTIPISQHLGVPANIVVEAKQKVKVGQILAKAKGVISANVHASVSGTISKIEETIESSGYRKTTITIDVEGDEWCEEIDRTAEIKRTISSTPAEIVEKVQSAGVVGLGGATFPSHVKLTPPSGKPIDTLIINGVECEPYLTSDHRLMLEKGEEVLVGIQILMKALKVSKAIIGIEVNKIDAIQSLQKFLKNYPGIEVASLAVKYPQGGEKQLIAAILGREVPSGKLPLDVGAVVQNVGTAYAVYQAVQKNMPLIERVVTITGKRLPKTANYWVRIGTPITHLLNQVGGLPEDTTKIIHGGPMMGKTLISPEIPIVKGTSGILIMTESETSSSRDGKEGPCIRCAKCVSVCPMGLEPYLLSALQKRFFWEDLEKEKVMDCIECGSCSYTCPSHILLLDYIRVGKNKVGQIIRNRKQI